MSAVNQSGWMVKLIGGPHDSPRPMRLLATRRLAQAPPVINAYRCLCCERTAAVAPGLHPHESELGPATVYRLEHVLVAGASSSSARAGTLTSFATYVYDNAELEQLEQLATAVGA